MKRSLLILAAVALGARWSVALLTERHPIFPDYYFADARLYDAEADLYATAIVSGTPIPYRLTPGRELYTWWVTLFYVHLGRRPLTLKLINGMLAAASVCLWFLLVQRLRPEAGSRPSRAAWAAGLMLALWPTHVFYTSQNTKEAMMLLALAAVFWLFLGRNAVEGGARATRVALDDARPVPGAAALVLVGLLRSHLLPMAAVALAVGAAWRLMASRRRPWALGRAAWDAVWVVAALALLRPVSSWTFERWTYEERHNQPIPFVKGLIDTRKPAEDPKMPVSWTPAWIMDLRLTRQRSDRQYARQTFGRQVQSQIFQDVEFRTWGDVLAFLPRGAFTVLLMPLPGFYPIRGNLGRLLASLENLGLLGLCLLAVVGLWRHGGRAERAPLAVFFLIAWMASALTEVDLGSATRHRLLYLPFLLPFAAWTASGRPRLGP
ncbi:MAG: hypothetical protein HY748_07300 [Elusimicrobia bacterium]|nr:hypothetical protein [Elusimicrobiota bacterium]